MTTDFEKYQKDIEEVIRKVERTGEDQFETLPDGTQVYAFPLRDGRIRWGISVYTRNFRRGIRESDGSDSGVM